MKTVSLGSFNTPSGKLIAIDPCYTVGIGCSVELSMLPGEYNAEVVLGQLVEPLFTCDKVPTFFRCASLTITHKDHPSPTFIKTDHYISVDSGQAGFFIQENYGVNRIDPVLLTNDAFNFLEESILSSTVEIIHMEEALRDGLNNDLYTRMSKHFNSEDSAREYFTQQMELKRENIKEYLAFISKEELPYYLPIKESTDFYKIVCNMTRSIKHASINSDYGVASETGLGDGGYELYLANNLKGDVVGATIVYLQDSDIK